MEGLSYFGVGAASGGLSAAFPGASLLIAGGTAAANSVLQQGYASNWQEVNGMQVLFSGAMSMLTSYVGGHFGQSLHVDKWFSRIGSPLARNLLENVTTNTIVGVAMGSTLSILDNDPDTDFWGGAWDGL